MDLNELSESSDRATTRRQQQHIAVAAATHRRTAATHQQGTCHATQTSRAMTAVKNAGE